MYFYPENFHSKEYAETNRYYSWLIYICVQYVCLLARG